MGLNRTKGLDHLRQSVAAYLEAVRLGRTRDDISMTFDWMERPLQRLKTLTTNDTREIFAIIDILIDRKQGADRDAIEWLFQSFAKSPTPVNTNVLKGLCVRTVAKIRKMAKPLPDGFEQVVQMLELVITSLGVIKPTTK